MIISLLAIAIIESNNCANIAHKSDAMGCYGLRPVAMKDISSTFSYKDQHKLARTYAKKIEGYSVCNNYINEHFVAYSWLNGPTAGRKLLKRFRCGTFPYRNPFLDCWYTRKYFRTKLSLNDDTKRIFRSPSSSIFVPILQI